MPLPLPPATAVALAALTADRTHGAAELAREAARIAAEFFDRTPDAATARAFVRALAAAQPTMASLLNLANLLALAWQADAFPAGEAAAAPAHRAAVVARAYPEAAAQALRATLAKARAALGDALLLATISHSSTVLALCTALKPCEVLVARSLPGGEGAATAAALRAQGHAARLVEDDALPPEWGAAQFIAGVDALGDGWFANKVGTAQLGGAARAMWLLATPDKRLPPGLAHWWRCGPLFERAPLGTARVVGAKAEPEPVPEPATGDASATAAWLAEG